jgi:hypothetical protein
MKDVLLLVDVLGRFEDGYQLLGSFRDRDGALVSGSARDR